MSRLRSFSPKGSFRVHEDLYILSDQVFGWDSDYRVLREAGVEAVRAHPGTYASGVLGTVWDQLAKAQFRSDGPRRRRRTTEPQATAGGLPPPTEGEPIPAGQVVWISRPDQSIRQVWTSANDWHFEFDDPQQRPRFEEIQRETSALFDALPDRAGNAQLGLRLNQLSTMVPATLDVDRRSGSSRIALRRPQGTATPRRPGAAASGSSS